MSVVISPLLHRHWPDIRRIYQEGVEHLAGDL